MKKTILISTTLFLSSAISAYALPTLQLDADPGEYISGAEESTISTSSEFTLTALFDHNTKKDYSNYKFFISIALTPSTGDGNFGSFSFDGKTFSDSPTVDELGMDDFGTPPIEIFAQDLGGHGIYDTWYAQYEIDFFDDGTEVDAYNVQPGEEEPAEGDTLLALSFLVDLTGLASEYGLHFDLYGFEYIEGVTEDISSSDLEHIIFAPFSHDAGTSVPEPATALLLGAGLIGAAFIRRKELKK